MDQIWTTEAAVLAGLCRREIAARWTPPSSPPPVLPTALPRQVPPSPLSSSRSAVLAAGFLGRLPMLRSIHAPGNACRPTYGEVGPVGDP